VQYITLTWITLALIVHITMFYITAPFGRHTSEKWGVMIDNKLGWVIMELPSLAIMVYFLAFGSHSFGSYVWILFSLWIFHYVNRTIIYPMRIKATPKKMPLFIALNAVFFNCVNAGLNGYYLAEIAPLEKYGSIWLSSPTFIFGIVLFFVGMFINIKSDNILINLRKPGETGYKIPQGFLFDYISSPNLFGEIIEWTGFAFMAWNLPALSFAVWTFANLVPRAKNHHDWYVKQFEDYPNGRKVVFPKVY
jgi:3-oxo-5-alpha-steroid 4-dehydrogenase 1